MATLRETFYDILKNDAKSNTAGALGTLLQKVDTEPYGVYFTAAPETLQPSYIVYAYVSEAQVFPAHMYISVTAYGDNYEAILQRVKTLLHDQVSSFIGCTDYQVLYIRKHWLGPDMWYEKLKVYGRQIRFELQVLDK